jgi:dipeptidyl aminopeptidase/acylaminoacyl peptidase
MTPDVILRQVGLEDHALSPDGRFAVVVRRFVRRNAYHSHLWYVPLSRGGGRTRRLTAGDVRDTQPRVGPDCATVAFRRLLVGDRDETARLMVVGTEGGEPDPIETGGSSVVELAWSPDGARIAFTAEAGPQRFAVGPTTPRSAPASSAPAGSAAAGSPPPHSSRPAISGDEPRARRITRIDWRWDEEGHRDRWTHLFVVPVAGGRAKHRPVDGADGPATRPPRTARPRQLTRGDFGVGGIAWRPDGREIAFVADRGLDADLHPRTTIWSVPAARGSAEPREILALGGPATSPAFSPDGRWLAAVGFGEASALDDVSPGIFVGPADGSGPAIPLAPSLDRPIGAWQDTDLNGWLGASRGGPAWADDRTVVALVTDRGRSAPWRFPFDPDTGWPSAPPECLVAADTAGWTLAVAPSRRRGGTPVVSFVGTLEGRSMELMTVEPSRVGAWTAEAAPAGGATPGLRLRTRTTLGSSWQRGLVQPAMRLLAAPGAGGPIDVWLASPPDAGEARLPAVVDIHGGPLGSWASAPSIEVGLLVSRGFRVILPNIRGSASYGRDWIRPQLGDWGGVDAADVHAAVDHVVGLGLADPDRLGILGLSYGGFMVNWLVGTSDRFRAAVSENGVANQVNAWANSDSGPEYDRAALLGDPLSEEGMLRLWRQSPLAHAANVRTPLLMLQGEADLRCPPADNEQFFIALRWLGREVEYILYPGEYHTFSITGRPDRRIDRMTRMLDWFDRHLRG